MKRACHAFSESSHCGMAEASSAVGVMEGMHSEDCKRAEMGRVRHEPWVGGSVE